MLKVLGKEECSSVLYMKVRFSAENSVHVHSIGTVQVGKDTAHNGALTEDMTHRIAIFPVNMNGVHYFIIVSGVPPPKKKIL